MGAAHTSSCSQGRPPLAASLWATTPCGLAAGGAYAHRRHPCRRQPCPRVAAASGGCTCWWLPLAGWLPLQGALAMADHPYKWLGHGWPPLQGAWPWPATPFLAAFVVKM
ncbi:hypothetical protein BHM03_00046363 [Ensete ventricosum]|nr:hypothetical protein BHM03_00046363 [Ensete ventricosum]